jgi:hypothetical protein
MGKGRPASPYKFLDSYGLRDHRRFFGRELETDLLLADVVVSRLVVLFAKTGTGKTSLINAGVRPRLHERGYKTFFIRVREDPFASARAALREQAAAKFPEGGSLADQVRELAKRFKRPVVLFFDQFEEFFLYTVPQDQAAAQEFVAAIGDLHDDRESGVHVVFSMREEWFVDMGFFRDRLPGIFHNDSNLRLRWFDPVQARDAIVKPAGEHAYAPALIDTLLRDLAATSRAAAPIPAPGDIEPAQLQIVCDTLWRRSASLPLTLEQYNALGEGKRGEIVAQRILDRRLVQEFEGFDRAQLELLSALLPELRTPEGTKRVREYADLVTSLISAPNIAAEPGAIRELVESLRHKRLLDLLPREGGEIVELTHDYLVARLDQLLAQITLIWPRRVLADGLKKFRKRAELLHSTVVDDVIAAAGSLELSAAQGELLLRSALAHLADVRPILPVLLDSGAPIWTIFEERIREGADAERARAAEMLIALDSPDAYSVLGRALSDARAAHDVLRLLGRSQNMHAVALLQEALERPGLAAQARTALAEIASAPGRPDVAASARETLRLAFAAELDASASASALVQQIVRLDMPFSVTLLEEQLDQPNLAESARNGLIELTRSDDLSVASGARQTLLRQVERALHEGTPELWCVDVLVEVADPEAVDLLGRLREHPALTDAASEALANLQSSPRDDVATAATRQLDRRTLPKPEHPAEPLPPEHIPPATGLGLEPHFDAVLRFLANGRIVPFLGPGASTFVDRGSGGSSGTVLPTPQALAMELAMRMPVLESRDREAEENDLARVAEIYASAVFDRPALYDYLHHRFAGDFPPNRLHRLFARLPRLFRDRGGSVPLIVTTAFDQRLEHAFHEEHEPVDVLTYMAAGQWQGKFMHRSPAGVVNFIRHPADYPELATARNTIILRLYGGVNRGNEDFDSFVITEDDYVTYAGFAADKTQPFLPPLVTQLLRRKSFLYLGHNLRDWNLRIFLNSLPDAGSGSRYRSWAVHLSPSEADVGLWRQRGVEIFDSDLLNYTMELERRLSQFDVGIVPA